jgi:hypothetical protein
VPTKLNLAINEIKMNTKRCHAHKKDSLKINKHESKSGKYFVVHVLRQTPDFVTAHIFLLSMTTTSMAQEKRR